MAVPTLGRRPAALVFAILASAVAACASGPLPEGFHEYTVFRGLAEPTNVEFAPDGRVFVAEKRGVVKVFDNLDDSTATVVADLRTETYNGWDRGMLGLAVPPDFASSPAIYVAYTYDGGPGETAPRWGTPNTNGDNCPTPPGYAEDGCVVTSRVSRLPLTSTGAWTGEEQVLLHDWCQQYPSHSIGALAFGQDGSLYVSGGDGASFTFADYGQRGTPRNPCGDPPAGVGGTQVPATSEGGALRSQDVRTLGDPTGYDGSILRIDARTGAPRPGNPLISSSNVTARRVVAHGLRNPFRYTLRPGTDELWIADVGLDTWEEVNVSIGNDAVLDNFGWPCYEGNGRTGSYDAVDIGMCEAMYATTPSPVKAPHFAYRHYQEVVPDEACEQSAGSSISGMAFSRADSAYPDSYDGALFFADAAKECIWTMLATNGRPDPTKVQAFVTPAARPVELQSGPNGDLWYVDLSGGTIRRVGYSAGNHPPAPAITATPSEGDPPLAVTFDASGSSDPDAGDTLTFSWDVDNDGVFDNGTGPTLTHTFTEVGVATVRVRAADAIGDAEIATTTVRVGDITTPVPFIDEPTGADPISVGESVAFSGSATDPAGNPLPPSALSWTVDLLHCPDACHPHTNVFSADDKASGSFVVPDHGFPTALRINLTATAGGESSTVTRRVDYRGTIVSLASSPASIELSAGERSGTAPYSDTFATGGAVTLSAPATAEVGGLTYRFTGWSDGGAASHEVTVPEDPVTYTATYAPA
ncbi:MAG TPA: PQQ-dependent sugar dehydrogenase [Acidimicrobiales bacterium]|nr:PQQ-dependent sugar dehydrogenase [Acidimicrobiales bacterium]